LGPAVQHATSASAGPMAVGVKVAWMGNCCPADKVACADMT